MENKDLYESLILFIRQEIREFKKSIDKETTIDDDLGVTREDAAYLIVNFGKKYSVDVSKFKFSAFFNEEPLPFLMQARWP